MADLLKKESEGAERSFDEKKTEEDVVIDAETDSIADRLAAELGHDIKYRTCSWQKTTVLLLSEYICLATLSFPLSFAILGIVPGILVTLGVMAAVLYTSLIVWKFCLRHPEVRDACDIGRSVFGGSQLAYNMTAIMFVLNNTFNQGLHCLVGAELLNTLTGSSRCTIIFSAVSAIACFFVSLPRTLNQLGGLGGFAATSMGTAILLAVIFAGVQDHPAGYTGVKPTFTAFPSPGITYISGMSAFLNITTTLIGQITLPTFIAEMKNPKDFPKALWVSSLCEVVIVCLCGSLIYVFVGNEYIAAPAFATLQPTFKKIAFSFAIPTIIYLGSLYCSVTARFVFFRLFRGSKHAHSHTLVGWGSWAGIIAITWVMAFVIAELIPFFSDMLSLLSALFGAWFGFIFWGMAYMTLYPGREKWAGTMCRIETLINYGLILVGFYMFSAGTYVSIQSIIDSYKTGTVGSPFSCSSNGI